MSAGERRQVSHHPLKLGGVCTFAGGSHRTAALNPVKGETVMKPSTKDKAEGKFHEIKGKIKEKAGQLTNNPTCKPRVSLKRRQGRSKGFSARWRKPWKSRNAGSSPTVLNENIEHSDERL